MPPPESNDVPLLRRVAAGWHARDVAPLVSLAALVAFFSLTAGQFLTAHTASQVLMQGSVRGIVAVGLTFVLLCGEIDLAVGSLAIWCACFAGWLFERWGMAPGGPAAADWRIVVVLVLPLLTCAAFGLAAGTITVWACLPSFIISLAMMFIVNGAAEYLTRGSSQKLPMVLKTLGNDGIWLTPRFLLPYCALLAGGVFAAGHVLVRYTLFGRYVYATGGNRQAARLNGIRTGRVVVACMAISAVAAGAGGLLNAGQLGSASLDQNADLLLSAVACVVLGGTSLFGGEGSMGKTLIGVLTYTVLTVGLEQIAWIESLARKLLTGLVLLAALIIYGLLAKKR